MRVSAISNNGNYRQNFEAVKIQPAARSRILTGLNVLSHGGNDFDLMHSVLNLRCNQDFLDSCIKRAENLPDVHVRTVVPGNSGSGLVARVGDKYFYEELFEPAISTLSRAIKHAEELAKIEK